jgi:hypothetical protein
MFSSCYAREDCESKPCSRDDSTQNRETIRAYDSASPQFGPASWLTLFPPRFYSKRDFRPGARPKIDDMIKNRFHQSMNNPKVTPVSGARRIAFSSNLPGLSGSNDTIAAPLSS